MNRSSQTQLDFFSSLGGDFASQVRPQRSKSSTLSGTLGDVSFPQFGGYAETKAETTRIEGRLIASKVSKEEYRALLDERQSLLDKKFSDNISRREEIRLEYVRWSLGRIEDAMHGQDLDRLEDSISRYEMFLKDLDGFKAALLQATKRSR